MTDKQTLSVRDVQAGLKCRLCIGGRPPSDGIEAFVGTVARSHRERLLQAFLREAQIEDLNDLRGANWTEKVRATTEHFRSGKRALLGPAFEFDNLRISLDLIEADDAGWSITEVRSIAHIRSRHYTGAAIVIWALVSLGIPVHRYRLATVNTEWTGLDPEPRFVLTDVTEIALRRSEDLDADIARLLKEAAKPTHPDGQPENELYCEKHDPNRSVQTPSSLASLYRVKKRLIQQLRNNGVQRIEDIPEDTALPPVATRQRQSLIEQRAVASPKLEDALKKIGRPTVYIDFEAIQPALPPWNGCRPFATIPVQVSLHRLHSDGTLDHEQWIAKPHQDPRPELARFLAKHLDEANTLVAYHATFEQNIISRLAAYCSQDEGHTLKQANQRFVDLLPMVRDHVYHPDFRGRFNLKGVVHALLPELRYDSLEVKRGDVASRLLEGLLLGDVDQNSTDYNSIRKALLEYCERDTLVLVRLEALLRQMAPRS